MKADDRPDPHLQAALRHAPDADLQAPEALRERVVAAARAALAADRAARAPRRRWWQALWPATPMGLGASGALATLALGGVIALLWRGEPLPPAVVTPEAARPPAAPAPAASVPAAPVTVFEASRDVAALKAQERRNAAPTAAPMVRREAARAPGSEERARAKVEAPAPLALPAADAAAKAASVPAAADSASGARQVGAEPAAPPAGAQATLQGASVGRERAAGMLQAAPPSGGASLRAPAANETDTRWLAEVNRVVQDRWRPSTDSRIEGAREWRAGPLRVAVGYGRVLWCDAGAAPPGCREATLEPPDERRLLESMPR